MIRPILAIILVSSGLAGCTAETSECVVEAAPADAPQGRDVFNVTEEVEESYPRLAELFASEGKTIDVDCSEGERLFRDLAGEGADVNFTDEEAGHDVYLRHDQEVHHAVVGKVVD